MRYPRRMLASLILALFTVQGIFTSQTPTPPSQPDTGPGGKQLRHTAATKNRYGNGGEEYWIYEPDAPRPKSAPVVIFLHGWGGTNTIEHQPHRTSFTTTEKAI